MERPSDIAELASAAERMALALASLDVSMRACASSLRRIDLTMRGEPIPAWLMNLHLGLRVGANWFGPIAATVVHHRDREGDA